MKRKVCTCSVHNILSSILDLWLAESADVELHIWAHCHLCRARWSACHLGASGINCLLESQMVLLLVTLGACRYLAGVDDARPW